MLIVLSPVYEDARKCSCVLAALHGAGLHTEQRQHDVHACMHTYQHTRTHTHTHTHTRARACTQPHPTWVALSAIDGEGFARAGLAVGKDAHVVAIHCRLHQVLGVLKHLRMHMTHDGSLQTDLGLTEGVKASQ